MVQRHDGIGILVPFFTDFESSLSKPPFEARLSCDADVVPVEYVRCKRGPDLHGTPSLESSPIHPRFRFAHKGQEMGAWLSYVTPLCDHLPSTCSSSRAKCFNLLGCGAPSAPTRRKENNVLLSNVAAPPPRTDPLDQQLCVCVSFEEKLS